MARNALLGLFLKIVKQALEKTAPHKTSCLKSSNLIYLSSSKQVIGVNKN